MRPRAGCGLETADWESEERSPSPVARTPEDSTIGSAKGTGGEGTGAIPDPLSPGAGVSSETRTTQLGHKPSQPSLGSGDPQCGHLGASGIAPRRFVFLHLPENPVRITRNLSDGFNRSPA